MNIKIFSQGICNMARIKLSLKRVNQTFVYRQQNNRLLRISKYSFTSCSTPSQVPLIEQVQATVMQIVKTFKPALFANQLLAPQKQTVDRNAKFVKLGFDSLDVTEMIVALEDRLGIELEDKQALEIDSIGAASQIFYMKMNSKIMNKIVTRNPNDTVLK